MSASTASSSTLTNAHQTSAELTLNPKDLGPLQVVLQVADNHAHALFVSQHSQVREAVEAALPKLREAMAARNLKPEGIYDPKEVVQIALQYLPAGPSYVFPLGPHQNADTLNEERRSRLLAVAEITKVFFGDD